MCMPHSKVDCVLVLFAASCLLLHGLNTTHFKKRGFVYAKLDKQKVLHYLNATLFTVIHACNMREGDAYTAAQLLHKHGVSIDC